MKKFNEWFVAKDQEIYTEAFGGFLKWLANKAREVGTDTAFMSIEMLKALIMSGYAAGYGVGELMKFSWEKLDKLGNYIKELNFENHWQKEQAKKLLQDIEEAKTQQQQHSQGMYTGTERGVPYQQPR